MTMPHADARAVVSSVLWLVLLDRDEVYRGRVVLAGLLFGLAFLTKFSAVTGPVAAGIWLLTRGGWRRTVTVVSVAGGVAILGVALAQLHSHGRMFENFRSLATGGMTAESAGLGPTRLLLMMGRPTPFFLVWPLALGRLIARARQRSWGLWEWYLLASIGVALPILSSPGTESNHLLEFQAACVIVLARRSDEPRWSAWLSQAVGLAAIPWALWVLTAAPWRSTIDASHLAAALPPGARVLAEDACVPTGLGNRPVVLDPFSFRLLAERGWIDDEPLADRVRQQEFDALVMLTRIDRPDESLSPHFHFGPRVTAAMLAAYRYEKSVGQYHVYRRKR